MKYVIVLFALFAFTFQESGATCNVPDGWTCDSKGGEGTVGETGPVIGYARVVENHQTKSLSCNDPGNNECKIRATNCFAILHNDLLSYANDQIVTYSILSGSHNINMIISGTLRYGYVTWTTNGTTGISTINTTIN
ncbi:MAG: hypothetical protein R2863_06890 [Candidatus Kapaibacterium sp.]